MQKINELTLVNTFHFSGIEYLKLVGVNEVNELMLLGSIVQPCELM